MSEHLIESIKIELAELERKYLAAAAEATRHREALAKLSATMRELSDSYAHLHSYLRNAGCAAQVRTLPPAEAVRPDGKVRGRDC